MATYKPFLVAWNLTRQCNLRCGHCYMDAGEFTFADQIPLNPPFSKGEITSSFVPPFSKGVIGGFVEESRDRPSGLSNELTR